MSMTNAAEAALLDLIFLNTDWANIGDAGGLQNSATAIGHMEGDITPFTDLSPENLAASVLAAVVEDDVSLGDVLRILLAHAAGDATGLDTNPAFKSHDGSKTRVAGTISSGARTITTFDAT